jgi:hypothetical protein
MTNLSYEGAHLIAEETFDMGEQLTLVMPRMQKLSVQVRWVEHGQCGVRFLGVNAAADRRARIGV